MSFPPKLVFRGSMRISSYDARHGLRMERVPESRFRLWFGLFFSVGLVCVGVFLFWRLAYAEFISAGALNWLHVLLFGIGLVCAAFGMVVALPLAARFLPRTLVTTHEPPVVRLQQLRRYTWRPEDVRKFRLMGRQYVRRTDPESPSSWCVFSLIVETASGGKKLLLQTLPQPDYEAAYEDISPAAQYFAQLLHAPVEMGCSWEAPGWLPGKTPGGSASSAKKGV